MDEPADRRTFSQIVELNCKFAYPHRFTSNT